MARAPQAIALAFFCAAACAQGQVQLSRTSLSFTGYAGGDPPAPQSILITSASDAVVRFTIQTDSPQWLSFTPKGAVAPARVGVKVDPSDLAAGTYQARIQISDPTAGGFGNIVVPVTFTVDARPPTLDVSPGIGRFYGREGSGEQFAVFYVRNGGGGGRFNFSVSVLTASPWVVDIFPKVGIAGPNVPFPVKITVSAQTLRGGAHSAVVRFTSPAGTVDLPIALFAEPAGPRIGLNPRGGQIEVRQDAGVPLDKQISVLDFGGDPFNWTVDLAQPSSWLRIKTGSGASTPSDPGTATITIDPTGLKTGVYYALLRFTAPQARNSPQFFPQTLVVLDPATPPRIGLAPAGLFFAAVAGQPPPAAKTLQIQTSSTTLVAFKSSGYTEDGGSWLSLNATAGSVSSSRAGQTTVSVNHANLKAGVYTGEIAYSFSNSEVRAAAVTLVVLPAGARLSTDQRQATGCTATRLTMTQSATVSNFTAAVGWPATLVTHLVDDCAEPVANGQIVLTYSNGDPAQVMTLSNAKDGSYSATWIPTKESGNVAINAIASSGLLLPITAQLSGSVVANKVPILFNDGTVDNFSFASGAALAPGTIVAIFGSDMAVSARAPGVIPFRTEVEGTRVLIGGIEAPLHFVSGGQINAQIPAELEPNRLYQVLVTANGALTVPDIIPLVAAQPTVQALGPDKLVSAQHASDFSTITATAPARPGESIIVYALGLGQTNPPARSGAAASGTALARALIQPTVTIDGRQAEIIFAGLTPGLVGLQQINLYVPAGSRTGNLDLVITQGSATSNQGALPVRQ